MRLHPHWVLCYVQYCFERLHVYLFWWVSSEQSRLVHYPLQIQTKRCPAGGNKDVRNWKSKDKPLHMFVSLGNRVGVDVSLGLCLTGLEVCEQRESRGMILLPGFLYPEECMALLWHFLLGSPMERRAAVLYNCIAIDIPGEALLIHALLAAWALSTRATPPKAWEHLSILLTTTRGFHSALPHSNLVICFNETHLTSVWCTLTVCLFVWGWRSRLHFPARCSRCWSGKRCCVCVWFRSSQDSRTNATPSRTPVQSMTGNSMQCGLDSCSQIPTEGWTQEILYR